MIDLKRLSVIEAELIVARDQVARLLDVMRRCDHDYVMAHGLEHCEDGEWDEVIEEAEDWLDEMREPHAQGAKG